jgi:hypothetical protein
MVEYKAEFLLCIGDSGYGHTGERKQLKSQGKDFSKGFNWQI